jgi:hypothetical protein
MENRFHDSDIPLPDEFDAFFRLGLRQGVGYWHDVGHAQLLAHLGCWAHEEWLGRFTGRMIGIHLHDMVGVSDHCKSIVCRTAEFGWRGK